MPKIKKINVSVTYKVEIGGVKMPKKVLKEIYEATDSGHTIDACDHRYPNASDWLRDNIQESYCMDWECEVNFLKTVKSYEK